MSQDNVFFTASMTNAPLPPLGGTPAPNGILHTERRRLLWDNRIHERLLFTNYGSIAALVPVEIRFAADYHDMFEVRGQPRTAHGQILPPQASEWQATSNTPAWTACCGRPASASPRRRFIFCRTGRSS